MTHRLGLIAFDIVRGVILGVIICYCILAIAQIGSNDLIFRYAGY